MLIGDVFKVFKQGKSLRNPEVWRSKVALANAIAGLLSGAVGVAYGFGWLHIQIDSETVQQIALGVASAYGIANSLLHVASSKTAGLPADLPEPSLPELHTEIADTVPLEPITPRPPKPDDTFFG